MEECFYDPSLICPGKSIPVPVLIAGIAFGPVCGGGAAIPETCSYYEKNAG